MFNAIPPAESLAKRQAYQYHKPVVVVLDLFSRSVRTFVEPHREYLKSEPQRYWVVSIAYPDGEVEKC